MTFKPGTSGNPRGKPVGARNKATMAALTLLENGATDIVRAVIEAARSGDIAAAKLVLDRLVPNAKERPVRIDLPDTSTAEGIALAQAEILRAVGGGELLPGEGATVAGILENRRRALETQELEARITILEGNAK